MMSEATGQAILKKMDDLFDRVRCLPLDMFRQCVDDPDNVEMLQSIVREAVEELFDRAEGPGGPRVSGVGSNFSGVREFLPPLANSCARQLTARQCCPNTSIRF
jgi:hypothetical protein